MQQAAGGRVMVMGVAALLLALATAEEHQHRRGVHWAPPVQSSPVSTDPCDPDLSACDRCNIVPICERCDFLCNRPDVPPMAMRGFSGLAASASASAAAGEGSTATTTSPAAAAESCLTPLKALATSCGSFLTRSDPETPQPQSECCAQLAHFVNSSISDDGGDGTLRLRCMSPLVLSHVNELLHAPLDPARMMYLPMLCGVVFPPEVLYVCLTGQQRPPLVTRIPEAWEKPALVPAAGH